MESFSDNHIHSVELSQFGDGSGRCIICQALVAPIGRQNMPMHLLDGAGYFVSPNTQVPMQNWQGIPQVIRDHDSFGVAADELPKKRRRVHMTGSESRPIPASMASMATSAFGAMPATLPTTLTTTTIATETTSAFWATRPIATQPIASRSIPPPTYTPANIGTSTPVAIPRPRHTSAPTRVLTRNPLTLHDRRALAQTLGEEIDDHDIPPEFMAAIQIEDYDEYVRNIRQLEGQSYMNAIEYEREMSMRRSADMSIQQSNGSLQ